MYTLVSGFYKNAFRKDEYYVLILGMNNAGKTTFVERLKAAYVPNYRGFFPEKITPTVGLNVARIELDGIRMILWDLGGAPELHSIWEKYYAGAHAIVYVVDGTDQEMLTKSKPVFDQMIQHSELAGLPLVVLVNKLDLPDALPLSLTERAFFDPERIGDRPARLVPISALAGDNVRYFMSWLVTSLKVNIRPPTSSQ